ncbi:MAG: FtsW/RodA/SpoVE family cell cycle protein [Niabella sp.]
MNVSNKKKVKQVYHRRVERLLLLFATIILGVMVYSYYNNIKDDFINTDHEYSTGQIINLVPDVKETVIKNVLTKGGYFTDEAYVDFITKNLVKKINEQKVLPNLGSLNKKDFLLDATLFTNTGSESGKLRFINSLAHLGMDSALYHQEIEKPIDYPSTVQVQAENTGINIKGIIDFDHQDIKNAVTPKGVLVKLTRFFPDAYYDTLSVAAKPVQTVFYARTDEKGRYEFSNVAEGGNYSVLPMKPGFEFGISKGKVNINNVKSFNFSAKPHQLRLLDRVEYRQIKNDKIFTVRTPSDFKKEFFTYLILFVVGFWVLHFALSINNYKSDQFLLPLLMFLLSIGIVTLYAVQDPLRDEVYGTGTAKYSGVVLLLFSFLAFVFKNNPVNRFYQSQSFDPVHRLLPAATSLKAPRGYTWLLASIAIMCLLLLFGSGPEGSGVKVNLFGFQVSELSKYLMVVFFAAYFTVNADYFRNITDNRWLLKKNALMLVLFIFLLIIYAALGDLGPAIVLCITFLFFYSFAKDEFSPMLVSAFVYGVVLLVVARFFNTAQENYLPWIAVAVCVGSLLFAVWKKKYESVFFILLVISSFILLATLPFEFTQRLADRNSMYENIWDNYLVGGDQVAQGVWSLSSGGWWGQGLGKGFPNVMPAHHTDMIVQSIGEELGILVLICILIVFGLLIYRCMLTARRTGKPFMFYLIAGIAITTMIQFMLIVAGTLGLVPLTGISVPFLSKGNAGIIITMIAFLLIVLMSNERGDKLEMEYVKANFDNVNAYAILTFFGIVIVFSGTLFWYLYKADDYITKPALVINKKGEWQYTYNPRIGILLKDIKAGNIYDRNGVLLATSNKNKFEKERKKLEALGASQALYNEQLKREQKRYYSFGNDLLFWLGDYNKEIAREENSGYAADFRHFTLLRGFDVKYATSVRTSDRYKEHRFLPETTRETELQQYDYSALAPFIKQGKNSELVNAQNRKEKDVYLSLDVVLNERINKIIQQKEAYKKYRTSVVAINTKTGDVLASAMNPMPSYKDLKLISNIDPLDYRSVFKQIFGTRQVVPRDLGITFPSRPGSTIKILDAYAALNKFGLPAANIKYFIEAGEIIRPGEPANENVDMKQAIVRSSNIYFIKLVNDKKLQTELFNLYDATGMNLLNRGGFYFQRPEDYESVKYFKEWEKYTDKGKNIFNNKRLLGSRKRFYSNLSNIAWGQGELMATPLHMAKMSGAIANNDTLQPSRFLLKSWMNQPFKEEGQLVGKQRGMGTLLASYMKEQSAKVSTATGLIIYGKTGSPERDKVVTVGNKTVLKRVTDAWFTFFLESPKTGAPVAFTIRVEEIGNSEFAKELAIDILKDLKSAGYF